MNIGNEFIIENGFIKLNINGIENVDMHSIDIANNNKQLGLLEVETEQFNDEISLIYNISGFKSLKKYLLDALSKEQAFSLLDSINTALSMQSYILDTGIVSVDINLIYVKEINNLPYCYFIYVPSNKEYIFNKENIKKVIYSILISIEDNDLRNEALSLYSDGDLSKVIELLKVQGLNLSRKVVEVEKEFEIHSNESLKEEEGTTCEVEESETTLLDDFEETILIEETVDYSNKVSMKLLINNNGELSEEHIYKSSTIIGRAIGCDVVIANKVISKKHAEIVKKGSDFYIRDIGSKNGVYVNDKRVQMGENIKLSYKDKIKFGNIKCSFER